MMMENLTDELAEMLEEYEYMIGEDTDAETLDKYLNEYNWDDGFGIPYLIINHPNCELATAVNAFWLAEGFVYFSDSFWRESKGIEAVWKDFVIYITEKILGGAYKKGSLPYPKRWAEELRLDIQKKKEGKGEDKIDPVFYGFGSAWE